MAVYVDTRNNNRTNPIATIEEVSNCHQDNQGHQHIQISHYFHTILPFCTEHFKDIESDFCVEFTEFM